MYGFRKPYTAAAFNTVAFFGMNFKFILVVAQTIGYLLSKWIGIKIVSEIKPNQRIALLSGLILFAELMWLLFGLLRSSWWVVCIFLNGIPLGMVFGLILSFLEGRRNSEALIAGLCASFIVSDGFSKSVGSALLLAGISERWMPFDGGLIFAAPLLLFVAMLSRVPPPDQGDQEHRCTRVPMSGKDRRHFFLKYFPLLIGIIVAYLLVTLMRSLRADFAREIWAGLGFAQTPHLYTVSEVVVSLGVIFISALTIYIKDHHRAYMFALVSSVSGFALCFFAAVMLQQGLDKFTFVVLTGLGVYIPYVNIHTTLFERLIAITREKANIGFLMYLVDSVGYTGYAVLLLAQNVWPAESVLHTFLWMCSALGLTGCAVLTFSSLYFRIKFKKDELEPQLSSR
jgi:hypothetical protein